MPRTKLTDASVKRLSPPKSGRVEYFDGLLPGFALRVTDRGARSWVVFYRIHGRLRRHTLGSYPKLSLTVARDAAREAFELAAKGEDPAEAKKRKISGDGTIKAIGEAFVERYAKAHQVRTWRETERVLKVDINPRIGSRPIAEIRKHEILSLLDKIAEPQAGGRRPRGRGLLRRGGPMAARNAFKVIRQLFRWAHEARGLLEANPIAGMKPPAPNVKRDRVLTDDEIRALWRTWSDLDSPFAAACKAMLLTGQRRDEVSQMRHAEIDASGLWTIPAERYKTNIPHVVPLSRQVRDLVSEQDQVDDSDYVFTFDGTPLGGWSKAKRAIDLASGVTGWQYRDLRRTARTLLTRHGVDFFIAERVIGHVIGGVAAVYDRYQYLKEKKRALETLATAVDRILKRDTGKIVIFRGRRTAKIP